MFVSWIYHPSKPLIESFSMENDIGIEAFTLRNPVVGPAYGTLTFIISGGRGLGCMLYKKWKEPMAYSCRRGIPKRSGKIFVTPRDITADHPVSFTYRTIPESGFKWERLNLNLSTLLKHKVLMLRHLKTGKYFYMETSFECSYRPDVLLFTPDDHSDLSDDLLEDKVNQADLSDDSS